MDSAKAITEMPNAAMLAFQSEMDRRNVALDEYEILLFETEDQYIVVTQYKRKPPRLRGSVEGFPDCEVRISRETHSVVKVTFAR